MSLDEEIEHLKNLDEIISKFEKDLAKEQSNYKKQLLAVKKRISEEGSTPMQIEKVSQMEAARPIKNPLLLWLALGNANLRLPTDRLTYKSSYEKFKLSATIAHLFFCAILLILPVRSWLDALSNFFLLYIYSTMTLREHILCLNGSRMKTWWIWHHYTCVVLSGTLLVWPTTSTYLAIRTKLLCFMIYLAALQVLQFRYQMNRLYTLRALSRVDPMQTTTESATVHLNSLVFLLPFIVIGYILQFYICFSMLSLAINVNGSLLVEWQLSLTGVLFGFIAFGNTITTIYTLYLKSKNHRNPSSKKIE